MWLGISIGRGTVLTTAFVFESMTEKVLPKESVATSTRLRVGSAVSANLTWPPTPMVVTVELLCRSTTTTPPPAL